MDTNATVMCLSYPALGAYAPLPALFAFRPSGLRRHRTQGRQSFRPLPAASEGSSGSQHTPLKAVVIHGAACPVLGLRPSPLSIISRTGRSTEEGVKRRTENSRHVLPFLGTRSSGCQGSHPFLSSDLRAPHSLPVRFSGALATRLPGPLTRRGGLRPVSVVALLSSAFTLPFGFSQPCLRLDHAVGRIQLCSSICKKLHEVITAQT